MALHVCLINPPTFLSLEALSYYGAVPPLSIAYIAASVRQAGHQVTIVDASGDALERYADFPTAAGSIVCQGLDTDSILSAVPEDAHVVGLSNMFLHEWPFLRKLLPALKEARPEAAIFLGGENGTAMWDEIVTSTPAVAACVHGEGEETFLETLQALEADGDWRSVPGLALMSEEGPTMIPGRKRMRDIHSIPRPAWDLLPMDRYFEGRCAMGIDLGRSMPMITSRGCPYECTFCSSPNMWTTRYIVRTAADVVDEIEWLQETYGVENIDFYDLTSFYSKAWIRDFHREITSRGVRITWQIPGGTRSETLKPEYIEMLHETGLRNLTYAPESGSQTVLAAMKKGVKLPRLTDSVRASVRTGIKTHFNIMVGFPHESWRDYIDHYRMLLRFVAMGVHSLSVISFIPYPGSEEYQSFRDRDMIDFSDECYLIGALIRGGGQKRSYHPKRSLTTIVLINYFYLLSFYGLQMVFRPQRAARLLWNAVQRRQETILDQWVASRLRNRRIKRAEQTRAPVLADASAPKPS